MGTSTENGASVGLQPEATGTQNGNLTKLESQVDIGGKYSLQKHSIGCVLLYFIIVVIGF